jgi:S1-C subfamily serine protease
MSDPFLPLTTPEPSPLKVASIPAGADGGASGATTPAPGAAAPQTGAPPPAGASPAPARRRRADVGMVLSAAVLSAVLASGATAALEPRPATTAASASPSITTAAAVTTAGGASSSLASIVAAVNPAVVTIDTTVTASGRGARGLSATGVGSGFIYDASGRILTAAHVVEGASRITVTLADGRTFPGRVVASDLARDVAVISIDAAGLPTIPLATATAQVGQTVMAIGDPLGDYPGSVTIGIVSGLDRSLTVADDLTGRPRQLTGMLQTDAAINPGNSGGPLVDTSGRVVGIISASSSDAQGMGFAVPISAVAPLLARAA